MIPLNVLLEEDVQLSELPHLDELSGAEILALMLDEGNLIAPQEIDALLIAALAPDLTSENEAEQKVQAKANKKLVARMLKKAREKAERKKRAETKIEKKITFLLEGDRLEEIQRCKRWEERLAWIARMQLAYRNYEGGGSGSTTSNVKPPPPPPTKYCSICKRSHP